MTYSVPNIVLLGKAGAGKTTCADMLVDEFPCGYRRYSIAAPLKDIATKIWGTEALTDRGKLQSLGVAVRGIDEDAWIRLCAQKIERETTRPEYLDGSHYLGGAAVVDDCRFPNELQYLKGLGFVSVRVIAGRNRRLARLQANGKLQDEAQLDHESETALDDVATDYVIDNSDDKLHLLERLTTILNVERR